MSRKNRKPRRRNPNTPTGYPTPADAEHTARVEAAKARREAECAEWSRQEAERVAGLTPEQRAKERPWEARRRPARDAVVIAALLGGLAK